MKPKKYEELKFTDDFMFSKVLQNNPGLCKEILELILDKKINRISAPEKQKTIDITADAKGVRFDIYVEDDRNTVYDVEMQTANEGNLSKRSRYYQGMIDLNSIERGISYKELKNSFIIFICMFDPFQRGIVRYTFESMCQEIPGLAMGSDAKTIFINPFGKTAGLSEGLKSFLAYLRGEVIKNSFAELLDDVVQHARRHDEWRLEYMTLLMRDQENIEKGIEQGETKKERYVVMSLLKKGLLSDDDIIEVAGITAEKLEKYKLELKTEKSK